MKSQKQKFKEVLRVTRKPIKKTKKKSILFAQKVRSPREQFSDIDSAWFPPDWNGDWDDVPGNR